MWAKIRKADFRLLELNTTTQGFDTSIFLEVETFDSFNATDDYVFNLNSNSFYNIGVKTEVAAPAKTETVASPFALSDNFRFRGQGYNGIASKSVDGTEKITTIDWLVAEDRLINGTHVMLKNHSFGERYDITVVDTSYAYAGILYPDEYDPDGTGLNNIAWNLVFPTGVPLDRFLADWYVVEDMQGQKPILLTYPASLKQGMTIRLTYYALGTLNDIEISLNGFMHKKDAEA